jgi:hypothetical protein
MFLGPDNPSLPFGVALTPIQLRNGFVQVKVSLKETAGTAGRVLFGFDPRTEAYFTAGLGGHGLAYLLDEYVPRTKWQVLRAHGSEANLSMKKAANVRLDLLGQRVSLSVDEVRILTDNLPHPLLGDQIGLFAWGSAAVQFDDFSATVSRPRAFVIMQFGEPFDSFYREVIIPVADRVKLDAVRGDDIYGPGVILTDIIRQIEEADVVIAEITPTNANVFYEVGYAHALHKPVVLLAERRTALPFDLHQYRCILYDDTIAGKSDVEEALEKHLRSAMSEWGYSV